MQLCPGAAVVESESRALLSPRVVPRSAPQRPEKNGSQNEAGVLRALKVGLKYLQTLDLVRNSPYLSRSEIYWSSPGETSGSKEKANDRKRLVGERYRGLHDALHA